ncbi:MULTISPECIES: hypothetical protein [Mesorhizobium]|uniref:RiPP n=1 Tax=Mesorhizobium abyssinicae TaxID=1209958 RepID=A0ABU5AKX3_9HYPH|nr:MULTISPECIES: hypothetical protein [Mesorhizobium]MDX8435424.1 hypothetical protein [Mesorhizobium abyssinicae]MDX8537942.1 hypothetical protein [Mesorhizobium abyssinicae]
MKKYEKPTLIKAARLQAVTAQQATSQPPVENGNSNGSGTDIN